MMGIGFPELMVILVIIMIIFGAGKLPEIGSAFGRSIKNFKSSMKEAEAEELDAESSSEFTEGETAESSESKEPTESTESTEEVKAGEGTLAKEEAKKPVKKKKAAKKEEDLIDEAVKELEKNRIGTIRTRHDGLVQESDVFTTSLGRTPGGRGRDRGVSRDTF
jgi:sec-independent protein translocase protein TatA